MGFFSILLMLNMFFSVKCTLQDGTQKDITERLKNYGAHALLFLNIKSYSGGTRPWKQKSGAQSSGDGLVEVVAMDNVDLALLNLGGTGESVCQVCCNGFLVINSKILLEGF